MEKRLRFRLLILIFGGVHSPRHRAGASLRAVAGSCREKRGIMNIEQGMSNVEMKKNLSFLLHSKFLVRYSNLFYLNDIMFRTNPVF